MAPISSAEATQFFDEFIEAFTTFDGKVIAERYQAPFLAVDSAGVGKVLNSPAEIGHYFQSFLDDYRASGIVSCGYDALEVVAIGMASALLTVTWTLRLANGVTSQTWRESYIVTRKDSRLFVLSSVDHDAQ